MNITKVEKPDPFFPSLPCQLKVKFDQLKVNIAKFGTISTKLFFRKKYNLLKDETDGITKCSTEPHKAEKGEGK